MSWAVSEQPQPPPRGTVLVVDDDEALRELATAALEDEGFQVRRASGGAKALASLREGGPPDLILLDLSMPGMDGRQVCAALREDPALATIPVLLWSADADLEEVGAQLGVAGCLSKPFDLDHLVAQVQRLAAPAVALRAPCAPAPHRWLSPALNLSHALVLQSQVRANVARSQALRVQSAAWRQARRRRSTAASGGRAAGATALPRAG